MMKALLRCLRDIRVFSFRSLIFMHCESDGTYHEYHSLINPASCKRKVLTKQFENIMKKSIIIFGISILPYTHDLRVKTVFAQIGMHGDLPESLFRSGVVTSARIFSISSHYYFHCIDRL